MGIENNKLLTRLGKGNGKALLAYAIGISGLLVSGLIASGPQALAANIVCTGFPCNGTEDNDVIDATNLGSGAFEIQGLGGNDVILGSDFSHNLDGGDGNDELVGGSGGEALVGGRGNDKASGNGGDDGISGGPGADTLSGGAENDRIFGDEGNDRLSGGSGDDELFGAGGNDLINGDIGNDFLSGLQGNDGLSGGSGDDTLFGYMGADTFNCGSGTDTILDFNPAQGDKKGADCENVQQKTGTIIALKEGNLGPQDPSDFQAEVIGDDPVSISPSSSPVSGRVMLAVVIDPGSYTVHEIGESGGILTDRPDFTVGYSDSCSGSISAGQTVTCTITNNFTGEE